MDLKDHLITPELYDRWCEQFTTPPTWKTRVVRYISQPIVVLPCLFAPFVWGATEGYLAPKRAWPEWFILLAGAIVVLFIVVMVQEMRAVPIACLEHRKAIDSLREKEQLLRLAIEEKWQRECQWQLMNEVLNLRYKILKREQ